MSAPTVPPRGAPEPQWRALLRAARAARAVNRAVANGGPREAARAYAFAVPRAEHRADAYTLLVWLVAKGAIVADLGAARTAWRAIDAVRADMARGRVGSARGGHAA